MRGLLLKALAVSAAVLLAACSDSEQTASNAPEKSADKVKAGFVGTLVLFMWAQSQMAVGLTSTTKVVWPLKRPSAIRLRQPSLRAFQRAPMPSVS